MSMTGEVTGGVRQELGAGQGIRLVVDYGTATTRAMACWPDQRRLPLVTAEGDPHWPSGVFVTADGTPVAGPEAVDTASSSPDGPTFFCQDLKTHLTRAQVTVGDRSVDPVAGLAALLHRLAQHAQQVASAPVTALTLTTPAGWGPRHRTALRAAAQHAGLPEPQLVPVPVAAGWLLTATGTADIRPGATLLLCDAGWSTFETSLLVRTTTGFAILATAPCNQAGGQEIQRTLSEHCLTQLSTVDPSLAKRLREPESVADQQDRRVFDHNLHLATQTLAAGSDTSVLVPPPYPPIPISHDRYTGLLHPLAQQAADTTASVLDAAGVDRADLAGVYALGGWLTKPLLQALTERGLEPVPLAQPEYAAVTGAADTPLPHQPTPTARTPARRWHATPALGAVIAALCSLALAIQAIGASQVGGYYYNFPILSWGEYAMACCYALLATTTAAHAPTRPPAARQLGGTVRVPRLVYAANAGIVVALGYAAAGVSSLQQTWSIGSYLRWALLPVLPIALLASLAGILRLRYPAEAARAQPAGRRRWFPLEATATAGIGMLLLQIPLSAYTPLSAWDLLLGVLGPDGARAAYSIFGHTGAALLGAGTALAATATVRYRLLTVPVAAAITGLIAPFDLATTLGLTFVAAATLWWMLHVARLLIAVAPRWRSRTPSPQQPTSTLR